MNQGLRRTWQRMTLILKTSTGLKLIVFFTALILLSSLVVFVIERRENDGFISFFDSLWWTIVTISTVGYGDRLPQTVAGRIVAIGIIFFGLAIMGTITGRIASFLLERQMKEENGQLDYSRFKGHFIVCGWKREMDRVLNQILEANPGLNALEIVLVHRAGKDEMNAVRNHPCLKGIKYVQGDFMEERELIRAGIKGASKVLVLADYLTKGDLQQIDSKTVMAVMSVKNLNKTAYVCAELLDTKFEKYLRLSHCDEILFSRDFSRSILASAASGTGLSHVVGALIGGADGVSLTTVTIPGELAGKTYQELKCHMRDKQSQLIGVLENTGNILVRKKEALREAQKNADISALIPELRGVKKLTANNPVINPPDDYILQRFCRAIVISGSTFKTARESAS